MADDLLWATKNGDLDKVKHFGSVVSESKSMSKLPSLNLFTKKCYFVFSLVLTLTKSSLGRL